MNATEAIKGFQRLLDDLAAYRPQRGSDMLPDPAPAMERAQRTSKTEHARTTAETLYSKAKATGQDLDRLESAYGEFKRNLEVSA